MIYIYTIVAELVKAVAFEAIKLYNGKFQFDT